MNAVAGPGRISRPSLASSAAIADFRLGGCRDAQTCGVSGFSALRSRH
jgi:hypothetical protein